MTEKKLDEGIKTCQKSIAFIHNQKIYINQFIEKQIQQLIQLLQDKQINLQSQLDKYLKKKLEYYTEMEKFLLTMKKNCDFKPYQQPEVYEDDKIMDFSNLKIINEEIQKFGRRITGKKSHIDIPRVRQIKENIMNEQPEPNYDFITPNDAQLFYKLGQKFVFPKHRRIFAQIRANDFRFGFYYDCDLQQGYNNADCYIYTLLNFQNTLPMKIFPIQAQRKYAIYLQGNRLGFGKDGKDLLIDFDNLSKSSSELGQSYAVVSEIDPQILAGKKTNWTFQELNLFYL
ncbi:hypothetical protein pb186bvf_000780 [Paramecium bursaria]